MLLHHGHASFAVSTAAPEWSYGIEHKTDKQANHYQLPETPSKRRRKNIKCLN
jgi:hypothetical protein